MGKQVLVIDRAEPGRLFVSVEGGTLTVGPEPGAAEAVLRGVQVARIRCEIEVGDDVIVVGNVAGDAGTPLQQELRAGDSCQIGQTQLRLESVEAAVPEPVSVYGDDDIPGLALATPTPATTPSSAVAEQASLTSSAPGVARRLFVVDGADQGRVYALPESGAISVGKSHKHSEIVLNDLYVSRLHCELHIQGDQVMLVHIEGQNGTLLNNQPVTRQEMHLGDVLRVGNSHLRLELGAAADSADQDDSKGAYGVTGESTADEGGYEIIDDETEVVATDSGDASGVAVALPHSPVDELLKLEDQTLGHFQIGPLLGRGQSSLVFRADDQKTKHTVALKVLSPDFPKSDVELQRFVKALKSATQLPHPSLVALSGAGKTGAYCWIAREFVEGESLARLITRLKDGGKLDWTRACRVALHVGKLLDHLHKHKVTHGNLTPRNILIRTSDKLTKVTDLMLNQALEGSHLQKAVLGKKLLLELPYIAPEQTDPHTPVAPVGELYALGAVLYALLTGQPPFAGESAKELLAQIREGKVARPSKLQKGIPPNFEAVVLKLLARNKAERFQSATELLAAVDPIAHEHDLKA